MWREFVSLSSNQTFNVAVNTSPRSVHSSHHGNTNWRRPRLCTRNQIQINQRWVYHTCRSIHWSKNHNNWYCIHYNIVRTFNASHLAWVSWFCSFVYHNMITVSLLSWSNTFKHNHFMVFINKSPLYLNINVFTNPFLD